MSRIKGGLLHAKRRRNILKRAKGYKWGKKKLIKQAKTANFRAGQFAYVGRKNKKRTNRGLWLIRINAAARELGLNYSRLSDGLKKKNIALDRKVLSQIAQKYPEMFKKIAEKA